MVATISPSSITLIERLQAAQAKSGTRARNVVKVMKTIKASQRTTAPFIGNRFGSRDANQATNVTIARIKFRGTLAANPHTSFCVSSTSTKSNRGRRRVPLPPYGPRSCIVRLEEEGCAFCFSGFAVSAFCGPFGDLPVGALLEARRACRLASHRCAHSKKSHRPPPSKPTRKTPKPFVKSPGLPREKFEHIAF